MSGIDQIVVQLTRIADALEPSTASVACEACGAAGPAHAFDHVCKEGGECDQRAAARRKTRGDLVHAPQSIRPLIEAAERFAQLARAFGDARPEENAAACAAAVDAEEALRLAARRLLDPDAAYVYAPTKLTPPAAPEPGDLPL